MTDPSFVVRDGDLEVSGETSWRGPVDGLPVRDRLLATRVHLSIGLELTRMSRRISR